MILEKGDKIRVLNEGISNLQPGDLIFVPDFGNRGLVSLVTSNPIFDSDEKEYYVSVIVRGYNLETMKVFESDNWVSLKDSNVGFIEDAIKNGDISAYASIAKKKRIPFNADYYYNIIER